MRSTIRIGDFLIRYLLEGNLMANKRVDVEQIRRALADYMWSEGCSCCQNTEEHEKAAKRLAELLNVPTYPDGSGYDFSQFRTTEDV